LDFEAFRNGFRDFGFISPRDVANVERVEFLKGPASVLYGSGFGFSGLVNTVTKKPLAEPFYQVNGTIETYDFYRSTIDFTGPLTEDKSLLYRLNAAYENADSFRDFNENESIFVSPALTWHIGPRTTLTTEFEYQNYDYVFDRGLLPAEVFFALPISRFLGEPDVNDADFESFSGTYNFEHEFSDN
jgi:iron complex outermembrane receptor protein